MLLEPKGSVGPQTCSNQEGQGARRAVQGGCQRNGAQLSKSKRAFMFPRKSAAQAIQGATKSAFLNPNNETSFRASWSRIPVQIFGPWTTSPILQSLCFQSRMTQVSLQSPHDNISKADAHQELQQQERLLC